MTDLGHALQASLGDSHRLERDLGGGGLPRGLVAREQSCRRTPVPECLQ
jgi:hypothetical protein